jgi:hypothetical protein
MSNPVRVPREFLSNEVEVREVFDKAALKDMQKDVETLKKVKGLREVNDAKDAHNGKKFANSAKDRQDARRTLKKLTEAELESDAAMQQRMKDLSVEDAKRAAGWEEDFEDPQPSLTCVLEFLVDSVKKVRAEVCGVCGKPVLDADPTSYAKKEQKKAGEETMAQKKARRAAAQAVKDKRPCRVHCGHFCTSDS